jgi:Lon-like ATP-dependent protease
LSLFSGTGALLIFVQIFFAVIIGTYFWGLLKKERGTKVAVQRESKKEMDKMAELRAISLTEPLAEKTRPKSFEDIVGQQEGLKALKAAICGPNPQHVIIYGPPGIGKTAAARLVLEEAKKSKLSPFKENAKFIELDATTARFDERGIADPLIGSVHDPIYQGAGSMGIAGIPQPKPGAVTKAHGGMLFIDEIGELHPIQMNKLLKVLEDRKVFLESAYYNPDDPNIPSHIHDMFTNGLPADFRLVGATTQTPQDIPPAIRSRCVEIFFRPLYADEIEIIAKNAITAIGMEAESGVVEVVKNYATNGREAVNMIQIAASLGLTEGRNLIKTSDIEWVISSGQHSPRMEKKIPAQPQIGFVNGLAVYGGNMGMLLEIEATTSVAEKGKGEIILTGIVEEEEINSRNKSIKRKSMAKSSVENVLTVLRRYMDENPKDYDIHINFPGGVPIDGPSAGIAIATAIYSAIKGIPVNNKLAMTGEISIRGLVKPVGGVVPKVEAAARAGAKRIIIPKDNYQDIFEEMDNVEVIPVEKLEEVFRIALLHNEAASDIIPPDEVLSASPL